MKNIVIGVLVGAVILFVVGLPTLCVLNTPKPGQPAISWKNSEEYNRYQGITEAKKITLPDVIQRAKPGVVHIMCYRDLDNAAVWQGSGFVVSEHLIVTARHVVKGITDFKITLDNGESLHATRAISSKKYDVGFIYIDDRTCKTPVEEHDDPEFNGVFFACGHKAKLHSLELGSIKDCKLGQQIFVVGSPYGQINFNAVSLGIISGLDRSWDKLGEDYGWSVAFTTDSAGHPGNSGCPVFSMDGKVRGILVGGFSPVLISVMPSDLFLDDLDEIELMFLQDKYQKEVKVDVAAEAWGY